MELESRICQSKKCIVRKLVGLTFLYRFFTAVCYDTDLDLKAIIYFETRTFKNTIQINVLFQRKILYVKTCDIVTF